ncbi:hypothetical protein H2O64_10405 [Kordia sp. YSTF-M3]|uniref:Uncharacterized protein n=1 Tax=Kordia aestuariivivens TaxID=2759037 RepID=A0ABR7Q956_9FLAO|nr:hypothetical protein [Kordia aestuariivivens]MBC8755085.1 hypothetical protein [Kordia aestuariivivens]
MGTFFTIIIILTILFVGGFTVLIAFVIKKSTTPKTAEFIENEKQQLYDNVLKKRKELHPHKAEMFRQVTDAMVFNYTKAVTYYKLSGVILNEQRKPIVAFERIERGMHTKGHLYAMTKKQTFYFDFTGLEATFYCNEELLGRFDKTGTIYNANETAIGHAKHPIKASFDLQLFKTTHHRLGEGLFPLTLNGRQLATINVAPNYDDIDYNPSVQGVFEDLGFGTPIITLTDTPTAEEENWLLAFAIFETAFHGHWLIP